MPSKKKLQVFISSTFTDLKEERQAAVEAILTAGHIPAGMELFTAGDESQMQVIKRWIDESDVYLLILGSRYGAIEPNSGKSYTHLEYEYAVSKGKPFFAVAISSKADNDRYSKGKEFVETDNPALLKEFRKIVTSKMVRFWDDYRDIKISILETMSEFSRRDDLVGWVPGNESTNSLVFAEEIARLTKENNELRKKNLDRTQKIRSSSTTDYIYDYLNSYNINNIVENDELADILNGIAGIFNDTEYSLLHYLYFFRNEDSMDLPHTEYVMRNFLEPLDERDFIDSIDEVIISNDKNDDEEYVYRIKFNESFKSFFRNIRVFKNVKAAERLIERYENS